MKLTLHEAIVVVLTGKPGRAATIEEIAYEINERGLYFRKDREPVPAYQIMQRTKLSKGRYHHLFEYVEPGSVILRDIQS